MNESKLAKFIVSGRVQGVGFRYFVYKNAIELGLIGYAKNSWDGTVEVHAEGEINKLIALQEKLNIGPGMSRVEKCKVEFCEPKGDFSRFEIR